jgi:L-arabinose isomerase
MKIMAEFGAGGSFSEFYLMDFKDDVIYLGHDGPAHYAIAEGKEGVQPPPSQASNLFWGKRSYPV